MRVHVKALTRGKATVNKVRHLANQLQPPPFSLPFCPPDGRLMRGPFLLCPMAFKSLPLSTSVYMLVFASLRFGQIY